MAYRPSKRRHQALAGDELNLTPIMNIFMIIIPFLLLTAVFAKTAIIDIYLPQEDKAVTSNPADAGNIEILTIKTTEKGFELGGTGSGISIPKSNGDLNFKGLSNELIKIKGKYPKQEEVILLFARDISYDLVVKVMDAARETTEIIDGKSVKRMLFPSPSLGENR